jgi:hypothetical protein
MRIRIHSLRLLTELFFNRSEYGLKTLLAPKEETLALETMSVSPEYGFQT